MMKNDRGFTLIEIMVVIVIIAVTASILVPAYGKIYAKQKFNSDVAAVENIVTWAHITAAAQDEDVTLSVNSQQGAITAEAPPPVPSQDQPQSFQQSNSSTVNSGQPLQRIVLLHSTTQVRLQANSSGMQPVGSSAPGQQIIFHGDGTCDGGDLEMIDVSGNDALLHIDAATSQVHQQDSSQGGAQ